MTPFVVFVVTLFSILMLGTVLSVVVSAVAWRRERTSRCIDHLHAFTELIDGVALGWVTSPMRGEK